MNEQEFWEEVKFDVKGLIPVVAQSVDNNEILMVAYMNRVSLEKSIKEGYTCYWSRSRNTLWLKGETSGHKQKIEEIWLDCDGDCIVMKVQQTGVACHTGSPTCFFKKLEN